MAKLFFTGIKHSGKSTFARMVSERLSLPWSDLDDIFPLRWSVSPREYYRVNGKEAFMKAEMEAYETVSSSPESTSILSLGGGACDNRPLMERMKRDGRIIYLRREEKDMLPVILSSGVPAFLDRNDVEGSFHTLFLRRDRIYMEYADLVIELGGYGNKEQTASMIIRKLEENGYVR